MTAELVASLLPPPPAPSDLGIATIGAGGIVNGAHIPQYQRAGFRVVGCADINAIAAQETRERWELAFATTDYHELLARDDVDVVLVAVRAEGRPVIVRDVVAAGKHVLVEKPFAHTYADAVTMVESAERAGIRLAVNQNRRWMPTHYATRALIDQGVVGGPFLAIYQGRSNQEYLVGTWYEQYRQFLLIEFCVHQLDLLLYWMGEPERVFATMSRSPVQRFARDLVTSVTLMYADQRRAQLIINDVAYFPTGDGYLEADGFSVDATTGYIVKVDDATIALTSRSGQRDAVPIALDIRRPSDSFACSMGDLLQAVAANREPSVSGRRNLATMRTVFAACRSAEEGRVVALAEIDEGVGR